MKNKKTAWFMLPLVLGIWGMIGWKVYAAFDTKDPGKKNVDAQTRKETNTKQISDTTQLIANYRDPFLDKINVVSVPKKNNVVVSQNPKPIAEIKPAITSTWPKVKYHGLIKRSRDQKTVGFLSVDDKSYFVQTTEAAGEIKVGKVWKDSVEVFWGREKAVVKK